MKHGLFAKVAVLSHEPRARLTSFSRACSMISCRNERWNGPWRKKSQPCSGAIVDFSKRRVPAAVQMNIARLEAERNRWADSGEELAENERKGALSDFDESKRRLQAGEDLEVVIPDARDLDRLLRYEASLERALDRALIQLRRLQLMRESKKTIDVIPASD